MNENSYTNWSSMTDKALVETIGKFVRHYRLSQNKSQVEVAESAGISRSTLSLLERGTKISLSSLIQVLRILDLLYIMDVFKVEDEISPIEYAKLQKNKRQRARKW
ncbi:MAG: helix-turn-helix transcriptional regulator [Candidatus Delongbacteria bacterium]|nr:helix-turn-helix transcriptional regulator [Candidatus Delongbacteria bacterium]MCG2760391.1 helix-turn-helix transcriptional regulator [Candidatus Delongbacteria bacterium]